MKIYLDLDGVFANFDKKVMEIMGGKWDRKSNHIWGPLSREHRVFWHLELIPDALRLISMLRHHDLEFLTALPMPTGALATAKDDKEAWIRKHISRTIPINTIEGGKNKVRWLERTPGAVLIDDFERNINLWNAAGGIGVLHETHNTDKTLEKLEELKLI